MTLATASMGHYGGTITFQQFIATNHEVGSPVAGAVQRDDNLAALAYNDPRFKLFADHRNADLLMEMCADPKRRLDPFNWDGKIPPGHAK
ncbi:hypothetical protein [Paraburkholderia tagetis]|uniref:Uncharacterized protein n=1 Tax=Paraburkholderia tagetis TaxID=2913261 RepID=A0A9X1UKA1_9BURK|nr:hypothetical protein [Paraburkholderia tagetis]MCG5073046.1 hypothetical protein [Paraburkholderia tagetis]